jgi:hypothetical protein
MTQTTQATQCWLRGFDTIGTRSDGVVFVLIIGDYRRLSAIIGAYRSAWRQGSAVNGAG